MKIVFALDSTSSEYRLLAKVMVRSALDQGLSNLHCLYQGVDDEFTRWLEAAGVKVLFHTGSLKDDIAATYRGNKTLSHALGTYLRLEIPDAFSALGYMDEFVLYVDVDVLFTPKFSLPNVRPLLVAGAPCWSIDNFKFMNTGVLVLNLPALRHRLRAFRQFLMDNKFDFESSGFGPCDQGAWNVFFRGEWERLPSQYNWKPFWGVNEAAQIVHFVGPNPFEAGEILIGQQSSDHWSGTHQRFVERAPQAYVKYLALWVTTAEAIGAGDDETFGPRLRRLRDNICTVTGETD